jgi:hypothetical protein
MECVDMKLSDQRIKTLDDDGQLLATNACLHRFSQRITNQLSSRNRKTTLKQHKFRFNCVKHIDACEKSLEHFKDVFKTFNANLSLSRSDNNWRVGFNLCSSLRKIVAAFVKTASELGLRVEIANAKEFKFRCQVVAKQTSVSHKSMLMQLFGDCGEYLLDFTNEGLPVLFFVTTCFKLFVVMKL